MQSHLCMSVGAACLYATRKRTTCVCSCIVQAFAARLAARDGGGTQRSPAEQQNRQGAFAPPTTLYSSPAGGPPTGAYGGGGRGYGGHGGGGRGEARMSHLSWLHRIATDACVLHLTLSCTAWILLLLVLLRVPPALPRLSTS